MTSIPPSTADSPAPDAGPSRPAHPVTLEKELWILAALLVLFVAANLLALKAQPVFSDEPGYTDPAASSVLGRGFTSGAWYAQPDGEFFASNVPLHELALIPWMETLGFGIIQARSINWLYSILAIVLIWDATRRSGWISKPGPRLAACGLLLFTETAYSINQLGRPDGITFLIAAFALWSFSLESRKSRMTILAIAGFAASWAGLQLVAAFFITCVILLVVWRKRFVTESASLFAGVGLGMGGLFLLYHHHGVWDCFVASVLPHTASAPRNIFSYTGFFRDRSFILLSACFIGVFSHALSTGNDSARKTAWFGLLMVVGLPLGLLACGKFSRHYTWMPSLAGILCMMSVMEEVRFRGFMRMAVISFMLAAAAVGYPRRVGISLAHASDDIHGKTSRFVTGKISASDAVIYASQAYFAVKGTAAKAYYYNWYPSIMTPAEADSVNVMIIEPRSFAEMKKRVGGEWRISGEPLVYPVRSFPNKDTWMTLAVYRRSGGLPDDRGNQERVPGYNRPQ